MTEHTTSKTSQEIPYGYCHCGCGQKTPIIKETNRKKGQVAGEPTRFIRYHHARVQGGDPLADRFWDKVSKQGPDECWEWTAAIDTHGYGQIRANKRNILAHRLAWELSNGPIPVGLFVCHKCDNRRCCNVNHLWLGTNEQNVKDMKHKGRARSGGAHGTMFPQAKLNDFLVAEIRKLYDSHQFNQYELAKMFNVSRGTICDVVRRVTWK